MSLSAIFDPVVNAYFKKKYGGSGGGAGGVDDGYYIAWDGNPEGRDFIDMSFLTPGLGFYKVSNAVLSVERLTGGTLYLELYEKELTINSTEACQTVGVPGLSVVLIDGRDPYVASGFAGDYTILGLDVTLPSDGTYFLLRGELYRGNTE